MARFHTMLDRDPVAHRTNVAYLLAVLTTACAPSSSNPPPSPVRGLCQIANEVEYFNTLGGGSIQVVDDTNAPGAAIALIQGGRRFVVRNPDALGRLPAAVQRSILAHEIGHHYLGENTASIRNEFLADAFAARVLTVIDGGAAQVEEVATFMEQNPRPGDATHAPDTLRAAYIRTVYRAVLADPDSCVPDPPE